MAGHTTSRVVPLLALALALAGCKKDEVAVEAMDELTALTDQIVTTVRDASDKKAGVLAAQALLDDREDAVGERLRRVGALSNAELSESAQRAFVEGLSDNRAKMAQLEVDLLTQSMRDEQLDDAVQALCEDHEAMLKSPPAP